jgi:hypothetical protein
MIPDRVLTRVLTHRRRAGACWVSTYSVGSHGYPQIGWHENGKLTMTLCHLVLWKRCRGPIPPGMTVDHKCHNRRCVRLTHLRLLPNAVNAADNGFAGRTHCPRGHEYSPENTHVNKHSGGRQCIACRREYDRTRRSRKHVKIDGRWQWVLI